MFLKLVTLVLICNGAKAKLVPKVIRGEKADIADHPHSVYVYIESGGGAYICASSVLNQAILLTAAHCLEPLVNDPNAKALAYTGHSDYTQGQRTKISRFKIHDRYHTTDVIYDIALIKLRNPLKLGEFVKRVAIMKIHPPEHAVLAAWGWINDHHGLSEHLHYVTLRVWQFEECRRIITDLTRGFICAGQLYGKSYAGPGDSGGGLIANGFLQIGLVSFTRPGIRGIVAFTDVLYYIDWIKKYSRELYCE